MYVCTYVRMYVCIVWIRNITISATCSNTYTYVRTSFCFKLHVCMHAYSMRLRTDENIMCRHDRMKKSAWGVCWTTAPLCISAKPAAGRRTKFTCSTVRRRQLSHPKSPARLYFNHGKYSNYSLSTSSPWSKVNLYVCMYVCIHACVWKSSPSDYNFLCTYLGKKLQGRSLYQGLQEMTVT